MRLISHNLHKQYSIQCKSIEFAINQNTNPSQFMFSHSFRMDK